MEDFNEDDETEDWSFRELVGSLMWLSISTRPDISNTVRSVARYSSAPKTIHWKAALGILAYINGTSCFGITYQRGTAASFSLEVFADLPMQTTLVKQPIGGLCQAEQLCVQVHMCVGFQERSNALPFQHLKQNMSP